MTARPLIPIELGVSEDIKLRGLEHPEDGPPVVLLHDFGADADAWGGIAAEIASQGFRVIRIELRGHGLSDGEPDPTTALGDVTTAAKLVAGSFGPAALVAYGAVAELVFALGGDEGVPVGIVVSPRHLEGGGIDVAAMAPAMRAIFVGAADEESDGYVRGIYPKLAGQNMWFSTGTAESGLNLLRSHSHLLEQLTTFLRRYLTGYHLAWIAEQVGGNDSTPGEDTRFEQ